MVRNFRVVKDLWGALDPVVVQGLLGELCQRTRNLTQGRFHRSHVVFGQVAAVGTGVGGGLVVFVQGLGYGKGGLGAKAETAVGLALQRGQVVEACAFLLAFGGAFFDGARLALALFQDGLDRFFVKDLFLLFLAVGLEPFALVVASAVVEIGLDGPELLGLELQAFFFALDDNGEGGGLHTAAGGNLEPAHGTVVGGKPAAAVHAHQPVGLGAAKGGVFQVFHVFGGAQVLKGILDGRRRHALHPEAL